MPTTPQKLFNSVPSNSSFMEKPTDQENSLLNVLKSAEDQLRETLEKNYTTDKLSKQIKFNAVCLKHLKNDSTTRGTVRIPELHYMLPLPRSIDDFETISLYPTFKAVATSFNPQPNNSGDIAPGSIIVVTFGNMSNFGDPQILEITNRIQNSSTSPGSGGTSSTGGRAGKKPRPKPEFVDCPGGTKALKRGNFVLKIVPDFDPALDSTANTYAQLPPVDYGAVPSRFLQADVLNGGCRISGPETIEWMFKRGVYLFMPMLNGRTVKSGIFSHLDKAAKNVDVNWGGCLDVGMARLSTLRNPATKLTEGQAERTAVTTVIQLKNNSAFKNHIFRKKQAMAPAFNMENMLPANDKMNYASFRNIKKGDTIPMGNRVEHLAFNAFFMKHLIELCKLEFGSGVIPIFYGSHPSNTLGGGFNEDAFDASAPAAKYAIKYVVENSSLWWANYCGGKLVLGCDPQPNLANPAAPKTYQDAKKLRPAWYKKKSSFLMGTKFGGASSKWLGDPAIWQFWNQAFFQTTKDERDKYFSGKPDPGSGATPSTYGRVFCVSSVRKDKMDDLLPAKRGGWK